MAVALDLSPALLVRVEARGLHLAEYIAELLEESLPVEPNAPPARPQGSSVVVEEGGDA